MKSIFLLYHVRRMDDDTDEAKFIGAFREKSNAEKCIKKYNQLPGFKDFPKGFVIEKQPIDKIYWKDGFKLSNDIQIRYHKDWKDD